MELPANRTTWGLLAAMARTVRLGLAAHVYPAPFEQGAPRRAATFAKPAGIQKALVSLRLAARAGNVLHGNMK